MNGSGSVTGFYDKILSKEGILGLICVILITFMTTVLWQSLQRILETQEAAEQILSLIKMEESEQTEILKDIRYSVKAQGGITFRNEP